MHSSTIGTFNPRYHAGWLDRLGMPHGANGDKLTRKAMKGAVGLTKPRGPYAALSLHGIKRPKRRR